MTTERDLEVFKHYVRIVSPDGTISITPIYELTPSRQYELNVEQLEIRVDTLF